MMGNKGNDASGQPQFVPLSVNDDGTAIVSVKSDNTHPDLIINSDSVTLAADNTSDAGKIKLFNTVPGSGIDFLISGAGVETITIKELLNAAGTLESAALMPINLATGALHSTTALANGSYRIEVGHGYGWHLQKSAAVETTRVVTYASTR